MNAPVRRYYRPLSPPPAPWVPPGLESDEGVRAAWKQARERGDRVMFLEWARAQQRAGALFAISHSAGKDSMAMQAAIVRELSIDPRQVLVLHADLHEVEWPGTADLARRHAEHYGFRFQVVEPYDTHGQRWDWFRRVEARGETLVANAARDRALALEARARGDLELALSLDRKAEQAQMASPFPSSDNRFCTSDLKTHPIHREATNYAKANGFRVVINCLGLRADEGTDRKSKPQVKVILGDENASVLMYTWLPIHHLLTDAPKATKPDGVFGLMSEELRRDPDVPRWHWAYDLGSKRLSCMFCFYETDPTALRLAASVRPELYARHVEFERRSKHSAAINKRFLEDLVGLSHDDLQERRRALPVIASNEGCMSEGEESLSTARGVVATLGEGATGSATLLVRPKITRHVARFFVRGVNLWLAFEASGSFAPLSGRWVSWEEATTHARAFMGGELGVASASPDWTPPPRFAAGAEGGRAFVLDTLSNLEYPQRFRSLSEAEATARQLNSAVA